MGAGREVGFESAGFFPNQDRRLVAETENMLLFFSKLSASLGRSTDFSRGLSLTFGGDKNRKKP